MALGRPVIIASERGPTGSGFVFMQQKEAANQLQADDMITHEANGEVEQVQRRVAQLQKHTPQIGLYSPHGSRNKNSNPRPGQREKQQ